MYLYRIIDKWCKKYDNKHKTLKAKQDTCVNLNLIPEDEVSVSKYSIVFSCLRNNKCVKCFPRPVLSVRRRRDVCVCVFVQLMPAFSLFRWRQRQSDSSTAARRD